MTITKERKKELEQLVDHYSNCILERCDICMAVWHALEIAGVVKS